MIEDGICEYCPYENIEKQPLYFLLLRNFLKNNKSRICILQLAKSKKDYFRVLSQRFFKKDNYFDNHNLYKGFLLNSDKKNIITTQVYFDWN